MQRIFVLCLFAVTSHAAPALHITHEFTNTNAQSLIGLPTGSHKTIVDKQGNLRWSHWSLQRKPLDSPFGFSGQLDGALAIESSLESGGRAVENAPTTLGGKIGFHLRHSNSGKMVMDFTPPTNGIDLVARFPIESGKKITSAHVDGHAATNFSRDTVAVKHAHAPVQIEVEFQ